MACDRVCVSVCVCTCHVPLCAAVPKVDNHCHAASLMTCTHLLEFMRRKGAEACDETVVLRGDRENVTLGQLFKEKQVNFKTLSISQLAVRMRQHMFYRCHVQCVHLPFHRAS